jgi:hypothetical protein
VVEHYVSKPAAITALVQALVVPISNDQMSEQCEAFISALSVLRFLLIRDRQTYLTSCHELFYKQLQGQQRRLRDRMEATAEHETDFFRFQIMSAACEAALTAMTISNILS